MPFHMLQLLFGIVDLRSNLSLLSLAVMVNVVLFIAHTAAGQMVEAPPYRPSEVLNPVSPIV
jgi:hypothetical protein|tara:strand:- start:456 stop:641 length:186 start_codon:yes stop_codon:yes gene_type:complete